MPFQLQLQCLQGQAAWRTDAEASSCIPQGRGKPVHSAQPSSLLFPRVPVGMAAEQKNKHNSKGSTDGLQGQESLLETSGLDCKMPVDEWTG